MRRPSFTRQISSEQRTPDPVEGRKQERGDSEPVAVDEGKNPEQEAQPQRILSSTRKKLTVVCLAIVYFATCAAFSILSPFFPTEAKSKGASGTVVGLIFGSYSLVNFIVSPFFGKMLPKVGARFGITCGLLLMGGGELLFGFVDSMPSGTVYIVFCFLLRIVSAIGGSMSDTAIFAIVAGEFPDNLGAVMGTMETFSGMGFMVGPPLGGVLFTLGGFKLPFLVLGGLVLLTLPMAMFVLPITDSTPEDQETGSLIQTLKIPAISILGSCIILSGIILGFLDPTLSPHISTFGLNPSQIGLMFLLIGAVYAFTAPLVGWVGDKTGRTRTLITLGIVFSVFGYLLLGPSPLLTFLPKRQVWLAAVSLIMLGLAISFYLVPVMPDMMITARRNGLPDDIRTHGILSGIFGALISVGAFLGPTLGGTMNHYLGFNWSATVLSGILALQGIVLIIFSWCETTVVRTTQESKVNTVNETSHLLGNPECLKSNLTIYETWNFSKHGSNSNHA